MATERSINYTFKATENVTTVAGRVQRALKSARKSEGAEAIEEIAKLGRGAGALVLLEMLARGTERVTQMMTGLRHAALQGRVGWAEYTDELIKSIPVIGNVWKAGRDLRAELDGTNAQIERATTDAKLGDALRAGRERVNSAFGARKAEEERFLGKDLDARIIEIKTERDRTVRAIAETLERDSTDPNLQDSQKAHLRAQASQEIIEADRMRRVREREAEEQDRVTRQTRRFSFADKGVEFLQKEAELQKAGAAEAAGKLAIVGEFARKKLEIHELLRRENITPEERALLKTLESALPGQEKEALRKFGSATPRFSGGVAPTQESYFSTGLSAAARENDPTKRIAKSSEVSAELLKQLYDLWNKYIQTPNFQFEAK